MQKSSPDIFEKYNPKSEIKRCPNGMGPTKALLHRYAKAMVNLNGVIKKTDLVQVFNEQTGHDLTATDVYDLLLHLVHKDNYYSFYKDYFVHYWLTNQADFIEQIIEEQRNKPLYVPPQELMLILEDFYYRDDVEMDAWDKVYDLFLKYRLRVPYDTLEILQNESTIGLMRNPFHYLQDKELGFQTEEQFDAFFQVLTMALNNSRKWVNRGHQPLELKAIDGNREPLRITMGPKDTCFCGSGKKYKKCCRRLVESDLAHLRYQDAVFFFETMYELYDFVNEEQRIIPEKIIPTYPNRLSDMTLYPVRNALWDDPSAIDRYLQKAIVTPRKRALLESWRDKHVRDSFILLEYREEDVLMLDSGSESTASVYAVKGIRNPIGWATRMVPPVWIGTVLLPFEGVIVYDGIIEESINLSFSDSVQEILSEDINLILSL